MDKQIDTRTPMTLERFLYEHSPQAEHYLREYQAKHYTPTPTPPAGQVEAVARAIYGYLGHAPSDGGISAEYYGAATEAIKASGAEHIAGLVAKNDELRDALLDMVWQFCSRNDKLAHSFMSAEEHAFDVLDLDNGMTYEEAEAASKAAALPPELRGK